MGFADTLRRHGLRCALVHGVYRMLQKCMLFNVSRLYLAETSEALCPDQDVSCDFRFLSSDEVALHAAEPELDLDAALADRIGEGYDFCYAALAGQQVIAYCFLALDSIEPNQNRGANPESGIGFSFRDDMAFRYNGFVHPAYRGKRIYGHLIRSAAVAMREKGIRRVLSTTEINNFSTRHCFDRLGHRCLGVCLAIGWGPYRWIRGPRISHLGIRSGREAQIRNRGQRESSKPELELC